jgi:hypothetical protein
VSLPWKCPDCRQPRRGPNCPTCHVGRPEPEPIGACDACDAVVPLADLVSMMAGGAEGSFCPKCRRVSE